MNNDTENGSTRDTPKKPVRKTLQLINAIQLKRLDKLIGAFKKREKKLVYIGGVVHSDETKNIWLTGIDRSNAKKLKIVRQPEQCSMNIDRSYAAVAWRQQFAEFGDEHNVVDLFQKACQLLPGFEAASARRFKERTAPLVTKQAVAPKPYDGSEPPLKFESPLFERSQILPSELCNVLGIGSTGSGKTVSFVMPTLSAMLGYRLVDGTTASMLVTDPKVELLAGVQQKLTEQGELDRLVVVGQCSPIDYFEENDGLTLTDRFEKIKGFVSVTSGTTSDDGRWQVFAEQLILSFLKDDQQFANVCGLALLESVAAMVTGESQYLGRNQWVALRKLLLLGMEDPQNLRHISEIYDVLTVSVGMTRLDRPFARYLILADRDQYFYNARGALTVVDALGSDEVEHLLDLSVRRGLRKKERTHVAELIERGAVLVFQPRQTAIYDMVGKVLKSLFFRCVMERADMDRPIGYVCDEFQRYITSDAETGEHNFLDRCRAYRVNSVLATQSMAALLAATNRGLAGRSALDSILVNTPTKVCFRTTDETAVTTMKSFIPKDPRSEQHILNFRPPSSLLTGEYYFAIGPEWGRTRYLLPVRNEAGASLLK